MWDPTISETTRAKKLKLKTQLDGYKKFSTRGHPGGAVPLYVILGPPNITESTRAEKVDIKNTIRYWEVLALRLGVQDPLV